MNIPSNLSTFNTVSQAELAHQAGQLPSGTGELATREAFDKFVGGTFYGQMLGAMQKTIGKPAYFHGGQAEEVFRSQLNQILADKMAEASADTFTGPMFELFSLNRQ